MSAETFNPRNLPIKTAAPVLPHPRRAGMETIEIGGPDIVASRIALGTWAIGGWMWGGSDARSAFRTIQAAIDNSVNLIDTAPVYGFGPAEEIVGRALAPNGRRQRLGRTYRRGSRRVAEAAEDRLHRHISPALGRS